MSSNLVEGNKHSDVFGNLEYDPDLVQGFRTNVVCISVGRFVLSIIPASRGMLVSNEVSFCNTWDGDC